MIRGLTRAGAGQIGSQAEFVKLAAAYGFGAVDIDGKELIAELGRDGAQALLAEQGVQLGAFGLPVDWRKTEADFRSGLDALRASAAGSAALGATACVTYILPSTDEPAAAFMARAVRRLRECARILGEHNVRLGLEFVGPHHLRTAWRNPFIWTANDTLAFADAIGEPNVGLLIDAYHCHTTGFGEAEIRGLNASQIVHAHINDAKDLPVEQILDNDRIYPGEGIIDLAGFLRGLHAIGYDGPVAQEILTPQPPADDAQTLLARSKAAFDKVFAEAGL